MSQVRVQKEVYKMKILLTPDVTHKKNKGYKCVVVQFFPDDDKHYFANKNNWMPLNKEVFALHQLMLSQDHEYANMISTCPVTCALVGDKK